MGIVVIGTVFVDVKGLYRPGLELVGYYEYVEDHKAVILGNKDITPSETVAPTVLNTGSVGNSNSEYVGGLISMNEKANEYSWFPLIVVACASFIIVLDSFFMNVSISRIVVDLNADVSTIQLIVSFCTLITAALILFSTKLQDIVGKKKLFVIGIIIAVLVPFIEIYDCH